MRKLKHLYSKERFEQMKQWALATQEPTVREIYETIQKKLRRYFDFDVAFRIYLYDAREKNYCLVYPKLDYTKIFIPSDTCLSYELEKRSSSHWAVDELYDLAREHTLLSERYEKIIRELWRLRAHVLVPMHLADDMVGLISLEKRKDTRPYSADDIKFIEKLAFRTASVFVNAMAKIGWDQAMDEIELKMLQARAAEHFQALT